MKTSPMSCEDVMAQLEAWGSENTRKIYARYGAGDNQFGVTLGNLRGLAKKLKTHHGLALQLWASGNADAMILATMLMAPDQLSAKEIERMVKPLTYYKLSLGERLGRFDKTPVPKGCTSTYAPEWITAALKRKK